MIRIWRKAHPLIDRLRSYEVVLDGDIIGRVNGGEVFEYDTSPGVHTLKLKIDWCGSQTLDFEIHDGEVLGFECGGLSGYKLLLALPITLLQRNRYLWLEQVGTYSASELPSVNNEGKRTQNPVQAGQKWKFVFRYGVLGWGLATGITVQIIHVITGTKDSLIEWMVNVGLFMMAGLCFGLTMWVVLRKRERMD